MTKIKTHEIEVEYQPSSVEVTVQLGRTALISEKESRREAFRRSHRKQDHGDAALADGHFKDEFLESLEQRGTKKLSKTELREAREEADNYLDLLSPQELQALADEILGEQSLDELEGFSEEDIADDEDTESSESSIVLQGKELSQQLRSQKRAQRADPYETRSLDDGDYGTEDVLAGMSIKEGRMGQ